MFLLPRSPLGQRRDLGQIVATRQFFEQQVRQRRRGFADGKARMFPAFEHHDGASEASRDHRHQRAAKARADHSDVEVGVHEGAPDSESAQASHATCASGSCERLILASRSRRAAKHAGQFENRSKSHVSANTRPRRKPTA